ncbi:MAG: hypothetical protein D3923_16110, partial [Candidatus Electrothrix sp. AR3]|nr:hypothetical protein [Candidatus Electrothrix sp. AR3]
LESVRPLPFSPNWINGVTNIRGEIVSVTDLSVFLNIPRESRKKSRTFIVIHAHGIKSAILVERITGTRLLYSKEGMVFQKDTKKNIPTKFLAGSALFLSENVEKELELFDGKKLLPSIRL